MFYRLSDSLEKALFGTLKVFGIRVTRYSVARSASLITFHGYAIEVVVFPWQTLVYRRLLTQQLSHDRATMSLLWDSWDVPGQ